MSLSSSPSPAAAPDLGRKTLGRLLGRFRPRRAAAGGVFLLLLLRSALEIAYPLLLGAVVEALAGREGTGGGLPGGYVRLVVLVGVVVLVRNGALFASQLAAARLGQDLENTLRGDLFRHVLNLRFSYHDENRSGKTLARSLRDMEKARHFFREVWFGYLEIALLVAAVLAVVFATWWVYGVVVLLTFGTAIVGALVVGRRIATLERGVSDSYDDVATTLQENVAGAHVVRAFGRERAEVGKFGGHMDRFTGGWQDVQRFWTGIMPGLNHVYYLAIPAVLVVGAMRMHRGEGGLGEVTAVLLYVRTVHHRLRPLTRLVILAQQAIASASRVFEVLDEAEFVVPPVDREHLPAQGGDLMLEKVTFGHVDGLHVLRGVDLHVPRGSSLGILGPTGSGKSSLVQLLPRFYDPDEGVIRLDGIDVRNLDIHELRAAVGLVFQEALLFSGTVADNIAYGKPDLPRDEIVRCARLAAAHEFVTQLPEGYETIVGERGVSLSGGQRQRLTIARALAIAPRVLIFDDATASVDAVTEKALFDGIRAAARGRTTLVISQRVTSVRWCDRIALLEDGVITGIGTHAAMLEESALYREIHHHQQLTRTSS